MVIINNARTGSQAAEVWLQLPIGESARLVPAVAVETSAERNLGGVELPSVGTNGLLSARVPAQSITTYVLRGEAAP